VAALFHFSWFSPRVVPDKVAISFMRDIFPAYPAGQISKIFPYQG
jgi:hypothetical protein